MTELASQDDGDLRLRQVVSHELRTDPAPDILRLPKNRSTGDLLAATSRAMEDRKLRVSFDTGSANAHDSSKSSVIPEHDHGLGISGLRRIRQQPMSRAPSHPSSPTQSYTLPPRSSSMTLGLSSSRGLTPNGPSSPSLNFREDLSRFPSESLHSFSFAHQSEDSVHNRHSVLRRAIEFMRERLGFGVHHPGVMSAKAKISGDADIQSMVDLLMRANFLGNESHDTQHYRHLNGPFTGPADIEGNIFEKAFLSRSKSPDEVNDNSSVDRPPQHTTDDHTSRSGSSHPQPSLNSETPMSDLAEPQSPPSGSSGLYLAHVSGQRGGLKRTNTDLSLLTLQTKLVEALSKPYREDDSTQDDHLLSPTPRNGSLGNAPNLGTGTPSLVHGHNNRWVPAAQAIFTTEASSPWTILAANDLACLVFGVTKAEVKKSSMLEVVREDRRAWLEEKLRSPGSEAAVKARHAHSKSARSSPKSTTSLLIGGGITAQLLSKSPWRQQRAQTGDTSDTKSKKGPKGGPNHVANKSRGVLLCGDIVPIQKRNGAKGAASLWVKEKKGGLIWVLEEIAEDLAYLALDPQSHVKNATGSTYVIWAKSEVPAGTSLQELIPQMPIMDILALSEKIFKDKTAQYYAARSADGVSIPVSITKERDSNTLRVSSFPHIAGIMVLSASTLEIMSSNSVFSAALFGLADPNGQKITDFLPHFEKTIDVLTEEGKVKLVDGLVVPENSFRQARALLARREGSPDAAAMFLRPSGLVARHRDGSEINVDVQMRVVRSERTVIDDGVIEEKSEDGDAASENGGLTETSEVVYALWITYSRSVHSAPFPGGSATPNITRPGTPHQPSPGQASRSVSPPQIDQDDMRIDNMPAPSLSQQIQEAASQPISESPPKEAKTERVALMSTPRKEALKKRQKITDFAILEEMGQGAYGQVKLARYSKGNNNGKKVVLKYVTKRRILVDTWTRDRRLGTVPLEIHVLDYLRKDGLRHPNIVEMTDFFEDEVNYYIEMVPHGLPGMDLFDYIEMRSTMDEAECRNIFLQVVDALHHLHTKALVVHRDIKDENIILDGEGNVKLIDFGSAAYIKNGPFDVFVGTIDYAAPEVLQGRSYRGKEQDIWALGILLYTLVYKENPFYSIDEILDHELRTPWIMSEPSIDLIKAMLNRDVDQRLTITQAKEHSWCTDEAERLGIS